MTPEKFYKAVKECLLELPYSYDSKTARTVVDDQNSSISLLPDMGHQVSIHYYFYDTDDRDTTEQNISHLLR